MITGESVSDIIQVDGINVFLIFKLHKCEDRRAVGV